MDKDKFIRHFDLATAFLIKLTQQFCFNSFSENHKFIIITNSVNTSEHLNDEELRLLESLNTYRDVPLTKSQVIDLLFHDNKVPLWINFQVYNTSETETVFHLICSRRLGDDSALLYKADQYPPFHPLVPVPPDKFRVEKNNKYDINYQKRLQIPPSIIEWWDNSRFSFVKTHFLSGALVILITAIIFYMHGSSPRESSAIIAWGMLIYLIYFGALVFISYIFEFLDRHLSENGNIYIRRAWKFYFWFTIIAPFAYPVFILTMFLT